MSKQELLEELKRLVKKRVDEEFNGSAHKFSLHIGINPRHIAKLLDNQANFTLTILYEILDALKYEIKLKKKK